MVSAEQMDQLYAEPTMAECPQCETNDNMASATLDFVKAPGGDNRVIACTDCQHYVPIKEAVDLIPSDDDDDESSTTQ